MIKKEIFLSCEEVYKRDPQDKQEIQTFAEEMCLTLLNVHAELASIAFRAVQSKKLAGTI